jgi:hypothetical protein
MQAIDYVQVIMNKLLEKRFPQVGGVGVGRILGEETEKRGGKTGTRDQGLWTRIARVGDWTVVIGASHLRLIP